MALGNSDSTRRIYLTVRGGAFELSKGKDTPPERFDMIDGVLEELSLYTKELKGPPVRIKHCLRILLTDGDEHYSIECGARHAQGVSTWVRMFAGYLHGITGGERIRIRTKGNDQNDKVSSCFVEIQNGTEWAKTEYRTFGQDGDTALKAIESHDSYKTFTPKASEGATGDEEDPTGGAYARNSKAELDFVSLVTTTLGWPAFAPNVNAYEGWFAALMKAEVWMIEQTNEATWMFFLECVRKNIAVNRVPAILAKAAAATGYDPFAEDGETIAQVTAVGGASTPVQTSQPAASGTNLQSIAAEVFGGEPAKVQTTAEPAEFGSADGNVPAGVSAFGWVPGRWFMPRQARMSATENQIVKFKERAAAKGLKGLDVDRVLFGLLIALKFPEDAYKTMAAYQVGIDFLAAATDEQVEIAKCDGDGYDPFVEK